MEPEIVPCRPPAAGDAVPRPGLTSGGAPSRGADPGDVAVLVRGILRLAAARDRDGMTALAGSCLDRPEVLGAALVLLGGELAGMRLDVLAEVLARYESAAGQLAGKGG